MKTQPKGSAKEENDNLPEAQMTYKESLQAYQKVAMEQVSKQPVVSLEEVKDQVWRLKAASSNKNEKPEKYFADAVIGARAEVLSSLLAESGEYCYVGEDNETIHGTREEFISWIMQKRTETKIVEYHFDSCINCRAGAPVVLFNQGYFPPKNMRSKNTFGTKERFGFMLEITEGRIRGIGVCQAYLKTENKPTYEVVSAKVDKYIQENDCCFHEAWNNLGIEKLLGHAPSPQMGDYDPNNRYLVVAELPKKGFILRTIDTTENWLTALIKMSLLSEDPEQERNLLIERFKSSAWYRINNSVHIPNSREEISTGLVNYRIIELSPEYTQWDFMKQRKAIKKS